MGGSPSAPVPGPRFPHLQEEVTFRGACSPISPEGTVTTGELILGPGGTGPGLSPWEGDEAGGKQGWE